MKNLVISVPRLEIHRPPISTAIVCNVIKQAGQDVQALDLNINFLRWLGKHSEYYNFDQIWDGERAITDSERELCIKFISQYKDKIDLYNVIWISVFGGSCHLFTELLCDFIRTHLKNKTIILGGQGVVTYHVGKYAENFGDIMKRKGLCDIYISGEGEETVVKVLNEDLNQPGVNNPKPLQLNELDNLPFPDYGYYNLDDYDYLTPNEKEVFIVGSRGCVRHCTYCDVARHWPKFRFRSGNNIASEMINHYEKHGVERFYFTDSLINGSIKAFHDMCTQLAKYRNDYKVDFMWGGQFIFRPKRQLPQGHYDMVAEAGGDTFYVGVETGSDKVRWEMDKKFTNDDTEWQLEEFSRNKLHCFFLMLVGYITETKQDQQDTLDMFPRWKKYVADGTIRGIDFGVSLKFMAHTPLERMIDSFGVYFLDAGDIYNGETTSNKDTNLWQCTTNPDLDVYERLRRRVEVQKEAIKHNWPVWRGPTRLKAVKLLAMKYRDYLADLQPEPKLYVEESTGYNWFK